MKSKRAANNNSRCLHVEQLEAKAAPGSLIPVMPFLGTSLEHVGRDSYSGGGRERSDRVVESASFSKSWRTDSEERVEDRLPRSSRAFEHWSDLSQSAELESPGESMLERLSRLSHFMDWAKQVDLGSGLDAVAEEPIESLAQDRALLQARTTTAPTPSGGGGGQASGITQSGGGGITQSGGGTDLGASGRVPSQQVTPTLGFPVAQAASAAGDEAIATLGEPAAATVPAPFAKLDKGVNLDVSRPDSGVWFKTQYDAAQMQAIAEAGFESVRIFMPYYAPPGSIQEQIDDALANNLSIVVAMWGLGSWSGNPSLGETQIASKWGQLASQWQGYSSDLVFEILNEPQGIGFGTDHTSNVNVMGIYNAAVQAIRNVDADRPILIGPPGYNDSEYLDPYVTETYLTYTFNGGTSFYDDPNTGVAIHFYNPRHEDGLNWAFWTTPLGNNESAWKDPITDQIMHAVDWRTSIGEDVPVVTTEWGAWMFDSRLASGDVEKWLDHHNDLFDTHDIGNMWYTGLMHNQRSFGIFNTETGWNQIVLDRLTGVQPTAWPNIGQVINGEFLDLPNKAWQTSTAQIATSIVSQGAYSGDTMLKLTVPDLQGAGGQFYLETYDQATTGVWEAPGRTLLHVVNGQTYKVSFIVGTDTGQQGQIRARLKDATDGSLIEEFDWVNVSDTPTTHELFYTHNAANEMDVRLEFEVGSQQQVLYLDKVELIRHGAAATYEFTLNTNSGATMTDYTAGANVVIDANPAPAGKVFDEWVFGPSVPAGANVNSASTSFTMPSQDLTATANYEDIASGGVNLLTNGDFENGTSPWQVWHNGASASYDVVNGEGVVSITSTTGALGSPQFVHPGLNLEAGTEYTLTFDARATAARSVTVYSTSNFVGTFDLTTSMQTFSTTFTPSSGSNRLDFLFGGNTADVTLDNIELFEPVVAAPGDFNLDGKVNGLDLLVWQRDTNVGLLSDWESNYGSS